MPLSRDDRNWLGELRSALWRASLPDRFGLTRSWPRDVKLTEAEWARLAAIIDGAPLVCEMGSFLGFSAMMTLYEPPAYPGLPAAALLTIEGKQVPWGDDDRRPVGFAAFHPFTHSACNVEWLSLFGLRASHGPAHYDY